MCVSVCVCMSKLMKIFKIEIEDERDLFANESNLDLKLRKLLLMITLACTHSKFIATNTHVGRMNWRINKKYRC